MNTEIKKTTIKTQRVTERQRKTDKRWSGTQRDNQKLLDRKKERKKRSDTDPETETVEQRMTH